MIVCVPTLKAVVGTLAPVPIEPLTLDVHARLALMLPFSTSIAVPVKMIEVPWTKLAPLAGAVIVTVGGVFGMA